MIRRSAALTAFTVAAALSAALPGSLASQEPAAAVPATHTVKRGDTLWDIAKLYLGDAFLWPEIYRLNPQVIEDPHWIYPGEVLALPGATAKVIAVTRDPAAPADTTATRRVFGETKAVTPEPRIVDSAVVAPLASSVRMGEYVAAPWVDDNGGPRTSGYLIQSGELPGIASADKSRMQLYDRVMVAPPAGDSMAERRLYLTYRLGPVIEKFGQIVIPTGIIQITRAPQNGEAAVARVVKMFGEVLQNQRVIPYDTAAAVVRGGPLPIPNGRLGTVRWIYNQPVLPSLQSYVILDIASRDSIATGDQIEFYLPRQPPTEGRDLAIPAISIGRAQVLRVTALGATAIITAQEQPKIGNGTAARIAAKMP